MTWHVGRACQLAECGEPIPRRAFQDERTVRACSATCAVRLFRLEHPDVRMRTVEALDAMRGQYPRPRGHAIRAWKDRKRDEGRCIKCGAELGDERGTHSKCAACRRLHAEQKRRARARKAQR